MVDFPTRPGGAFRAAEAILWIGLLGLVAAGLQRLDGFVVNVVNYRLERSAITVPWLSWPLSLLASAAVVVFYFRSRRVGNGTVPRVGSSVASRHPRGAGAGRVSGLVTLAVSAAVAAAWLLGASPTFVAFCVLIVGLVCSIDLLGRECEIPAWSRGLERWAPWLLAGAIAASTLWHAREQMRLWQQFTLGYADFGFFITDLEHCLPGKDVGPARFVDIRMGYHCLPFFYILAPVYALFRSPTFLMYVGPLALNLAAAPFYQLARHRTGSAAVGLFVGLAWLLLPSMSRLPYSNTYGFQNIYLAVPWLAWSFALAMRGRWKWSYVMLAIALACEETVCGVAFGWGAYLALRRDRRRTGVAIMIASVAYLLLATLVVIPAFAETGRYTRTELIANVPWPEVLARFARPRAALYLLALTAALLPAMVRGGSVLIAAVPTLLLVLLLRWEDYLSIKFWHQTSILPVLFLAATLGATRSPPRDSVAPPGRRQGAWSSAVALFVGALLCHHFMADSPLAKARYERLSRMTSDRPAALRKAVEYVRQTYPAAYTTVVATQRLAAHFTDYRMVFPAARAALDDPRRKPDICILDRRDTWDEVVFAGGIDRFAEAWQAAGLVVAYNRDGVVVLARPVVPH